MFIQCDVVHQSNFQIHHIRVHRTSIRTRKVNELYHMKNMECVSETSQIRHLFFFYEIHLLNEFNFLYNHLEAHRPKNLLELVIHYLVMLDNPNFVPLEGALNMNDRKMVDDL